jgi:glyoxylase-like metal-dependent hydrolase (beta-lactamase superfamily II)
LAGEPSEGIVTSMRKEGVTAKVTVEKLRDNIAVLIGSGGNIAVLHGPEGKLLIDAGLAGSRAQISAGLASLGAAPVRHVVNTHWHFDHTDGNAWLHGEGATIVAHENTRKRLSNATRVEDWDFTFPPAPKDALPTRVFAKDEKLEFGGTTVVLKYYGPAHTDTDVSAEFADENIIHLGDTWWNGHYPFVDYSTGGSIDGMIKATEANLARGSEKTVFIPGHGPVGDRVHLAEYRDMLVTIRERVATLKKQGRSIQDVIAAQPTASYDPKWGSFVVHPEFFVRLVYAGV